MAMDMLATLGGLTLVAGGARMIEKATSDNPERYSKENLRREGIIDDARPTRTSTASKTDSCVTCEGAGIMGKFSCLLQGHDREEGRTMHELHTVWKHPQADTILAQPQSMKPCAFFGTPTSFNMHSAQKESQFERPIKTDKVQETFNGLGTVYFSPSKSHVVHQYGVNQPVEQVILTGRWTGPYSHDDGSTHGCTQRYGHAGSHCQVVRIQKTKSFIAPPCQAAAKLRKQIKVSSKTAVVVGAATVLGLAGAEAYSRMSRSEGTSSSKDQDSQKPESIEQGSSRDSMLGV